MHSDYTLNNNFLDKRELKQAQLLPNLTIFIILTSLILSLSISLIIFLSRLAKPLN